MKLINKIKILSLLPFTLFSCKKNNPEIIEFYKIYPTEYKVEFKYSEYEKKLVDDVPSLITKTVVINNFSDYKIESLSKYMNALLDEKLLVDDSYDYERHSYSCNYKLIFSKENSVITSFEFNDLSGMTVINFNSKSWVIKDKKNLKVREMKDEIFFRIYNITDADRIITTTTTPLY